MEQFYVGVKIVRGKPMARGKFDAMIGNDPPNHDVYILDGYAVTYPGGYVSWSPKNVFESAYLSMETNEPSELNDSRVTAKMVDEFMGSINTTQIDNKTTMVSVETPTGFVIHETSSCVDPDNFDLAVGGEVCANKISDKLWAFLGFVVQWGKYGLKSG